MPLECGKPEGKAAYRTWVEELALLFEPGARVLDLGCGAGIPATKILADAGFEVLGIDISDVQIERARMLVPNATFVRADMVLWEGDRARFDAVVAFYSLIHLPVEDQRLLISRIPDWLVANGYLMAIVGYEGWTGTEDYLGAPMRWDQADTVTYLRWFTEAGLTPRWHRFVPEGDSGHSLVVARRR